LWPRVVAGGAIRGGRKPADLSALAAPSVQIAAGRRVAGASALRLTLPGLDASGVTAVAASVVRVLTPYPPKE